MSFPDTQPQRLLLARQLIREKRLSRTDLSLLEDILREGARDLEPLLEADPGHAAAGGEESPAQATLRRSLGYFMAFLHQFSPRQPEEAREAMGLVLLHSLARLGRRAEAADLGHLALRLEAALG